MWEEKRRVRSKGRRSRLPTEVGVVVLISGTLIVHAFLVASMVCSVSFNFFSAMQK